MLLAPISPELYCDLYMDADEFIRFRGLLIEGKNLLIEGTPAVGKSLVAKRLARALAGEFPSERVESIQFHPAYSFGDFIHGYRPGPQGMELRDGVFSRFCREALKDPDHVYVLIIDELNRADPAAVFGEILTLMEPDKRAPQHAMPLLHARLEGERFYVPANVHIVATANSVDALVPLDSGVRRRFATVHLEPAFGHEGFIQHLERTGLSKKRAREISRKMERLNKEIVQLRPGPAAPVVGHGYFHPLAGNAGKADWPEQILTHYIVPQIRARWKDEPDNLHRLLALL